MARAHGHPAYPSHGAAHPNHGAAHPNHGAAHPNHSHGSHAHGHAHVGLEGVRLDQLSLRRPTHHRVGRRRFVADLGRGTLAMAIATPMATLLAACGSSGSAPTATSSPSDEADDVDGGADAPDGGAADDVLPLEWSRVNLGFVSAYVLVRGNEAAVVDTGTGGSEDAIGQSLGDFGLNFSDVAHVILTHAHGDHVGSLQGVLSGAPNAIVHAGEADIPNIRPPVAMNAVGDGDDVFGLQIINTPGHTPGSIAVLDPTIGLLFPGDAILGNTDGTAVDPPLERFSSDLDLAYESVKKLSNFAFDQVAFGHGEPVLSGAGELIDELAASL